MGAPAKFLFDLDFSAPGTGARAANAAEAAQDIAAAEARGYRSGFEAAQREIRLDAERQLAQALAGVAGAMHGIAAQFSGVSARVETEAVEVGVAVARQLAGALVAQQPVAGIKALVEDCFRHLVATPHLVVRVGETVYESARGEIEALAKTSGFAGRLVILAEPDIATGDCRIEWADGGVVLERAAIEARINDLVARYLASRRDAGAMPATVTTSRMTP